MSKTHKFVVIPDGRCTGLWCTGNWTVLNEKGLVGDPKIGYPMSPKQKTKYIKFTKDAIKVAQNSVQELTIALERLRTAPTRKW